MTMIADRTTAPADLSDRDLWVQMMIEDRALAGYDDDPNEPDYERHGLLDAEIRRRFGNEAPDNTADWSVAHHMSSTDLVEWAEKQFNHLLAVATGRISLR